MHMKENSMIQKGNNNLPHNLSTSVGPLPRANHFLMISIFSPTGSYCWNMEPMLQWFHVK